MGTEAAKKLLVPLSLPWKECRTYHHIVRVQFDVVSVAHWPLYLLEVTVGDSLLFVMLLDWLIQRI